MIDTCSQSMKNMNAPQMINSIYRATEGEGIHLGRPQVFVRYQGCNIGCVNCDSKDTWDFLNTANESTATILNQIFHEGYQGSIKFVSITGGDPLHPKLTPGVLELAIALKKSGYGINIEAAGSRVVDEIFSVVDFISFDFKTPSTKVLTPVNNIRKMLERYEHKTQIKAVVETQADFDAVLALRLQMKAEFPNSATPWVLTPCYNVNETFPMERFSQAIAWNESHGGHFRVIGQQHKWIHGPDKKLV